MRMGSLSEACIATDHSGNAVLGIHPAKTEGRTHVSLHKNPKSVSVPVRLSFGKTSCCKALAAMTSNSGNLTGPLCL